MINTNDFRKHILFLCLTVTYLIKYIYIVLFHCGSECACVLFNCEAIQYELPTAYVVCGKVIFSVMSVFSREEGF